MSTKIEIVYARLPQDKTTRESLFTGKFDNLSHIRLELSSGARGTANFAIYENINGKLHEKISKRVTAGQFIEYSYSPQAGKKLEYYVNYYDSDDLPQAYAVLSFA